MTKNDHFLTCWKMFAQFRTFVLSQFLTLTHEKHTKWSVMMCRFMGCFWFLKILPRFYAINGFIKVYLNSNFGVTLLCLWENCIIRVLLNFTSQFWFHKFGKKTSFLVISNMLPFVVIKVLKIVKNLDVRTLCNNCQKFQTC